MRFLKMLPVAEPALSVAYLMRLCRALWSERISHGAIIAILIYLPIPARGQSTCEMGLLPFRDLGIQVDGASRHIVKDVDSDGTADLIAGVTVVYHLGDGTFETSVQLADPNEVFVAWTTADVNADGKLDIVGIGRGSSIVTFLGQGNRSFRQGTKIETGPITSVTTTDFNGDTYIDLVATVNDKVYLYLATQPGVFGSPFQFTTTGKATLVFAKELNGDGKMDLVIANVGVFNADVLFGNGLNAISGSFSLALKDDAETFSFGDMNGDGRTDIVAARQQYGSQRPGFTKVFVYSGDNRFEGRGGTLSGSRNIFLFDEDSDGDLDLLFDSYGIQRYRNHGEGYFLVESTQGIPAFFAEFPSECSFTDINGDRWPDVVLVDSSGVVQTSLGICREMRDIYFRSAADYSKRLTWGAIQVAFSSNLSEVEEVASTLPLPTVLAGVSGRIWKTTSVTPIRFFYASPTQLNFLLPDPPGVGNSVVIEVKTASGATFLRSELLDNLAPALFSANSDGEGAAAGYVVRVLPNEPQTIEQIIRYDTATKKYVATPIDVEIGRVFLVIFGTGFRRASSLTVTAGPFTLIPTYFGPAPGYSGLDQVNVELPLTLRNRGGIGVSVKSGSSTSNGVGVNIK